MSFTEKVFTLATVIVLSFFSAAAFLFESMAGNPTPPLETYYAGYIALGVSALSLIVYLIVSSRKKPELQLVTPIVFAQDEDKEIILRLVTEIKATTEDRDELNAKLQGDPNFSIAEVIEMRKRKVHQIYFTEVQSRLADDYISDLLHKFIMAFTDHVNNIKQDPAKALERLTSLADSISKLDPLLLRIKFKPKPAVAQLDPFFTEPLDRN